MGHEISVSWSKVKNNGLFIYDEKEEMIDRSFIYLLIFGQYMNIDLVAGLLFYALAQNIHTITLQINIVFTM